jgi:amidase
MSLAAPFVARFSGAAPKFNPEFATATETMAALEKGAVSSRELVRRVYARISRFNSKINAFMTLREEQAIKDAARADELRAGRKGGGALLGLPVTVKDAFATAGIRTTAGSKKWERFIPAEDAVAVAKLRRAGAIIIGKTNLPELSADLQSYNEMAGTTNNPWDLARTCGGSTGGGAAAVASGFTYGELGSDSAGSIRIPSHFCGVYGHKSTVGLVSRIGWMPPAPGELRGPNDWSVAGPIARSAGDLRLFLSVLGGPAPEEAVAYRWSPPPPRRKALQEYRVGFVLDDAFCPLSPDATRVLGPFIDALRKAGAQLWEGWPREFDPRANQRVFDFLTSTFQGRVNPSYAEWEKRHIERLKFRRLWSAYFRDIDVFLSPVTIVPAFPHDHSMPREKRVLKTQSGPRPYPDLFPWIAHAGLSGCPATVAPAGRTADGLPVGVQIMGPFLEDLTPIHFAELLAPVAGGFAVPAQVRG